MACTTRETVTRTLGQFRKEGWISIEDSVVTLNGPIGSKRSIKATKPALILPKLQIPLLRFRLPLQPSLRSQRFIIVFGSSCAYDPICYLLFCCSSSPALRLLRFRLRPRHRQRRLSHPPLLPTCKQFQKIEDAWADAINRRDQYSLENVLSPLFVDVSASGDITTRNQQLAFLIAARRQDPAP